MGIIGMGEVGSLAAGMARAFGMRVLYCNRNRLPAEQEQKAGAAFAEIGTLLAELDFVSLHATNIPANKGLIDGKTFGAMKSTAFFINTARGPIVDEGALYDALTEGTIAGAGLTCTCSNRARSPTTGHAQERDPYAAHRGRLAQGRAGRDWRRAR